MQQTIDRFKRLAYVLLAAAALSVTIGPAIERAAASVVINGNTPLVVASPADPTGTTSTTGVMMGLGAVVAPNTASITPTVTGRVKATIVLNLTNSTATAGDGAKAQIRYGTGTAPANGAALTGTTIGSILTSVLERATANDLQGVTLVGVATGLTPGTAYWFDVSLAAIVGGTGLAKNVSVVLEEF